VIGTASLHHSEFIVGFAAVIARQQQFARLTLLISPDTGIQAVFQVFTWGIIADTCTENDSYPGIRETFSTSEAVRIGSYFHIQVDTRQGKNNCEAGDKKAYKPLFYIHKTLKIFE
jgi:hypothetical protein